MDTPASELQTTPPIPSPQVAQQKKKSRLPLYIIIALLLALILGWISKEFFVYQKARKEAFSHDQIIPIFTPTTTVTPTSVSQTTLIPASWTYENSVTCNIALPLPPNVEPYAIPPTASESSALDRGGSWKFAENNRGEEMFPNVAQVFYFKPDLPAGDYVAGNVQVACAPNTQKLTPESLLSTFKQNFTNGTYAGLTFKDRGKKILWGHTVVAFSVEGGFFAEGFEEYLLATSDHIYRISTYSASSTPMIKQTTKTIFDNILIHED